MTSISVKFGSSIADPDDTYRVDIEKNGSFHKQSQYEGAGLEGTTTQCSLSVGPGQYDASVFNASRGELLDLWISPLESALAKPGGIELSRGVPGRTRWMMGL